MLNTKLIIEQQHLRHKITKTCVSATSVEPETYTLLLLLLLINSVKTSIEDYTQMNLLYLAILLVVYSSID